MKIFTLIPALAYVAYANPAADTPCQIKQQNAASFQLAQSLAVPVQSITIVSTKAGPWTEMSGGNSGADEVVVGAPAQDVNGKLISKSYTVAGKQIGESKDCAIVSVNETPAAKPE